MNNFLVFNCPIFKLSNS